MLFLLISFFVAINPVEKILVFYGFIITIFALIFSGLNIEKNTIIDLALLLIMTKTTLLIIATKFRKL